MSIFTDNTNSQPNQLLSPLRRAEGGPSLEALKLRVAAAPAPRFGWVRPLAWFVGGSAVVTGGLFLALSGNTTTPTATVAAKAVQTATIQTAPAVRENNAVLQDAAQAAAQGHVQKKATVRSATEIREVAQSEPVVAEAENIHSNNEQQARTTEAVAIQPASVTAVAAAFTKQDDGSSKLERLIPTPERSTWNLNAMLLGGAIVSKLNTSGYGAVVSVTHDWQYAAIRYNGTLGDRHNGDQLFGNIDRINRHYSQNINDVSVVVGGVARYNAFYGTLAAGLDYTHSFSRYETPDPMTAPAGTPIQSIGNEWRGLGLSMQASVGYTPIDRFSVELGAFSSYHSQLMYGGVMLGVNYRIF